MNLKLSTKYNYLNFIVLSFSFLFLFFYSIGQNALAATNDCDHVISKSDYVVRTDVASPYSANKLYDFVSIRNDLKSTIMDNNFNQTKAECLKDFYNSALSDASNYWVQRIAKEGCTNGNQIPTQKPNSCNTKTWNEFQNSRKYLNNLQKEWKIKLSKILDENAKTADVNCNSKSKISESELTSNSKKTLTLMCCGSENDSNGIVRVIYPNDNYKSCLEKMETSKTDALSISGVATEIKDCIGNMVQKALSVFWENTKGLYDTVTDTSKLAGAYSAIKDLATNENLRKAFFNKIESSVKEYIQNRTDSFKSCLNPYEQGQLICSVAGEIVGAMADPLAFIKLYKFFKAGSINISSVLNSTVKGEKMSAKLDQWQEKLIQAKTASQDKASVLKNDLTKTSLNLNAKATKWTQELKDNLISFDENIKNKLNQMNQSVVQNTNKLAQNIKNKSKALENSIPTFRKTKELSVVEKEVAPADIATVSENKINKSETGTKLNENLNDDHSVENKTSESKTELTNNSDAQIISQKINSVSNESNSVGKSTLSSQFQKLSGTARSAIVNKTAKLKTLAAETLTFVQQKKWSKEFLGHNVIIPRTGGSYSPAKVIKISKNGKAEVEWNENGVVKTKSVDISQVTKASESLSKAIDAVAKYNLYPESKMTLGNESTIQFSKMFADSGGRLFTVAQIENQGAISYKLFYKSNSQSVFRLLPARNKNIGLPGYDKGPGEEFLTLPSEVQKHLSIITSQVDQKNLQVISPDKLEGLVKVNRNVEEYHDYKNSSDYPKSDQFTSHAIINKNVNHSEYDGVGRFFPKPHDIEITNPKQQPNFKNQVNEYQFSNDVYGQVKARIYKSLDGTLEYTLMQDDKGRVWFGDVGTSSKQFNDFGLRTEAIDAEALTMPLWEYHDQIPTNYRRGVVNSANRSYSSSWEYIKNIPEVQRWYKEMGKPIPEK